MKTYTDAELAAAASKRLSQLLGYDNGGPFKNPNGTYWSLGSGNNHFFRRDEENGEPQLWCRYPEDHHLCQRVQVYLQSLLNEPCECGAPWCAECAAEAKAICQRSREAEANFIAGGLDTEAPPV